MISLAILILLIIVFGNAFGFILKLLWGATKFIFWLCLPIAAIVVVISLIAGLAYIALPVVGVALAVWFLSDVI